MRFICTEFNSNTNDLYKKEQTDKPVIFENDYKYTKSNKINTKDGLTFAYCNDTIREILFSQFLPNGIEYTLTEWITQVGITGTDHTGITNDFVYDNYSAADILSSYFFTVIAEDGVHFCLPQRLTTSKEIKIDNNNVISEFNNYETDYSFQGETGKTFLLGESSKDTIRPYTIDSTLKSHRINKYKSKLNVITIQTNYNANPLDYVLYKGNYYLTISRTDIKNDLFLYTCIKEEKDSNTISGSSIQPNIALIDKYSTTETLTNKTWIDGRKIYRKVIDFGALPNATTKNVAHGITFISGTRIISLSGYSTDGTTILSQPFGPTGSATGYISLRATSTNVVIVTNGNQSSFTETYIILEYVY